MYLGTVPSPRRVSCPAHVVCDDWLAVRRNNSFTLLTSSAEPLAISESPQ